MRNEIIEAVRREKVIAIVRGVAPEKCEKVVRALYDGGIRLVEITYDQKRPDSWNDTAASIDRIADKYAGRMYVGAGTVTSCELVRLTKEHGGQYIISPNTRQDVIELTRELELVSMPGAFAPTEITEAYVYGADFVKLFPVSCLGPAYVKAVCAPLSNIPLLAVGGIDAGNIREYLKAGCLGAGVGGNLAKKDWIEAGEYGRLTEAAVELLAAVRE